MTRTTRWFLCLACLLASGFISVAVAQEPQWENLNTSGKLVRLMPGGLTIATDKGEQWNVKLPDKAKEISFMAETDTDFLKPDMMIRFSATMTAKGAVLNEIDSLTVFTPHQASDVGIAPDNGGGANPGDQLFNSPEKEEKKPVKKGPEQYNCTVGGQIVSVKGRKLVVSAGGTTLKCELADNAKVSIAVSDLSYAKLGDKVEVEGRYLPSNKAAGAMARSVSIIAANPLVKKKSKANAKPESKPSDS